MQEIDGSFGEGGGQILRTSLALSVITQKPFRLTNIRAGRKKPGLKRQHICSIEAAKQTCNAEVKGAHLNSSTIEFRPQIAEANNWHVSIGTAGSTMLVLQTVLPIMLTLTKPSTITVSGGTHNPMAPPFEFFKESFLGVLQAMGAKVSVQLNRYGFFPQGGGEVVLSVQPSSLHPISIQECGKLLSTSATIINLKKSPSLIREQESAIKKFLSINSIQAISSMPVGPGNAVVIQQEYESITTVMTGILKRGRSPKIMAQVVAEKMSAYNGQKCAVDHHLADQLLLPLLLAGGGSFTTTAPTLHSTTNAEVIRLFTGVCPQFFDNADHWICEVPALKGV